MDIFLIAGEIGKDIKNYLETDEKINIVRTENSIEEAYYFLENNKLNFDSILLLDYGIYINEERLSKTFLNLSNVMDSINSKIIFITTSKLYTDMFEEIFKNDSKYQTYYIDKVKIPLSFLSNIINQVKDNNEDNLKNYEENNKSTKKNKWSIFSSKESSRKTSNNKKIKYSQNISRTIVMTGHNGSGVSSTVANIGNDASNNDLKTLIIDLNLENKGQNLYFDSFGNEAEDNDDIRMSLIRCLLKPDNYKEYTCQINPNLFLTTLAYSISKEEKNLDKITSQKLINLITSLKLQFNLIILDIPLNIVHTFSGILAHIDRVGLCVNNNLYSVINTVKELESLEENAITSLKMKSNIVATNYNTKSEHNGKLFKSELISELLFALSTRFDKIIEVAGIIPYIDTFDLQIDRGREISRIDKEYNHIYGNILKKLIRE